MNDETDESGPSGPAEKGLLRLLGSLDESRLPDSETRTESIMRTARWQFVVRGTFRLIDVFVVAVADGVALAAGSRPRDRDKGDR